MTGATESSPSHDRGQCQQQHYAATALRPQPREWSTLHPTAVHYSTIPHQDRTRTHGLIYVSVSYTHLTLPTICSV